MFSASFLSPIVGWFAPTDPLIRIETLIDKLEKGEKVTIDTFGPLNEKHRNTYLLCALAWNRLRAAQTLLLLDKNNIALNQKDNWPTCRNTPLILAAKINASAMITALVDAGADVNAQDYRGFTALHYTCIYRNEEAITTLLSAGAKLHLQDAFGKLPLQYYLREITPIDLAYRYGLSPTDITRLNHEPDFDNKFYGTRNKCYSGLRWYIAHVLVNAKLGLEKQDERSLYDWASFYLDVREPVDLASIYNAMLACFCAARAPLDKNFAKQLKPDKEEYAAYLDSDQPALARNGLFALIPDDIAHRDRLGRLSIEMQQFPAKSGKKVIKPGSSFRD